MVRDQRRKRIQTFLEQMAAQDNRSTAFPYFYVIRTKVLDSAPIEACEFTRWYYQDDSFDSLEDLERTLVNDGLEGADLEVALKDAQEYGVRARWEQRGMFLTETDAEDHLKLNYYHYSPDAHTFIIHAWRAPELKSFLMDLFDEFGVDFDKW